MQKHPDTVFIGYFNISLQCFTLCNTDNYVSRKNLKLKEEVKKHSIW